MWVVTPSLVARAGESATLVLNPAAAGPVIPADFSGLSFETVELLPKADGSHVFRPENTPLIGYFKTLGIHSLRIGGNTTDTPSFAVPKPADLDSLFAFARKAGVKVILTLRLRQGDPSAAARIAGYVMSRYSDQLVGFSIGNEPNIYAPTYEDYVRLLRQYMGAVNAPDVAPTAVFCAPSTTPDHAEWARRLAGDFGGTGKIRLISQHEYPGGSGRAVKDPAKARSEMLSPEWIAHYESVAALLGPAAAANHLPYRLEETNNYYNGGASHVSDTLASALWALDYTHWWASHGAAGLNFHTGDAVAAADELTTCYYAAFWTTAHGYNAHPLAYALAAFEAGSHGQTVPVALKSAGQNLTAYAVKAIDGSLYVTLINKSEGAMAKPVPVTIASAYPIARAEQMTLEAPSGDVAASDGITLGGAAIDELGQWHGKSRAVELRDGRALIVMNPVTAAVIHLTAGAPAGFGID